MGTLREQMTMDLALKRFSESTQRTYLAQVRDISIYFKKSPDKLDRDEVKKYLHYLIEEKNYTQHCPGNGFSRERNRKIP